MDGILPIVYIACKSHLEAFLFKICVWRVHIQLHSLSSTLNLPQNPVGFISSRFISNISSINTSLPRGKEVEVFLPHIYRLFFSSLKYFYRLPQGFSKARKTSTDYRKVCCGNTDYTVR
jgi:hypothetical protein